MNSIRPLPIIGFLFLILIGCNEGILSENMGFISIGETPSDYAPVIGFQLESSNYILVGMDGDSPLDSPALTFCFSKDGALQWKRTLPDLLRETQVGIPDRRGGYLLAGFHHGDSARLEPDVTVMRFDQEGRPMDKLIIQAAFGSKRFQNVDMRWLDNGNIGIAITFEHGSGSPTPSFPRLVLLDPDLNVLYDDPFFPATGDYYGDINRLYVTQRKDGNICLIGSHNFSFPSGYRAVAFEVDPTQAGQHTYHVLPIPIGLVPVAIVPTPDSGVLIAGTVPDSTINQKTYSYVGSLSQPLGRRMSLFHLDKDWSLVQRTDHSGITDYGTVMDIQPTSDGGYMLLGTSGFSGNINFESPQRIFILKLGADLQKDFIHEFETTHSALGYRVREAYDGGFIIAGRIRSFDAHYNLMMIKTNRKGRVHSMDQ